MPENFEEKPGCIQAALQIIGEKWTALIIRELYYGSKRFNQLQHALPGISPRTLSQRLNKLEHCFVVAKSQTSQAVSYPNYSLTQKGQDFAGILQQMADWGAKYHSAV